MRGKKVNSSRWSSVNVGGGGEQLKGIEGGSELQ